MRGDVVELVGVYDADSTIVGEVAYWIGARLGRRHCSLCDLTHGAFRVKRAWQSCTQSLAVPFVTFHRNDAPCDVLDAAGGSFPVVLGRTATGLHVLLDHEALARFDGSTERFAKWLSEI